MSVPLDLNCLHGTRGPDSEAALTMLEKQLICPICLELFNKPVVILPCQHNLCRKCANELYQPSLFQARTTMLVNSGRFRCPSCRHEVVLDRHGVYGLQRNLLVENIIDAYKEEVSKHTATSLVPAPPPPAELTCSDHEGEKVNIYCLTCQVPICSLCKVFGAHQFCQVAPLTDIYQQKKDELSEGVSSLKADNYKIQAFISDLEESCCNIEDNCKTQKQIVCDTFSRLFSILEEKHKAMTQHISSEEEEKTSHAQAVVHCYRESVEANSKLMETAATFMEGLDMAAFVQNSRELITKVVSATSSCPTEMLKPGFENVSHYRCNFRRQESALRSIDFIKAASSHILQEPEVEPEPEEHRKPFILNTEPNYFQETSDQCVQTLEEPVKDLIPLPISAPVEAEQPAAPTPLLVPHLLSDSPEPCDLDEPHERSVVKNKDDEAERSVAPRAVKEGKICDGMSTQQAVTLLVYLLAFLVILHRVWAYVGCFICM
ncbi:tripartite motif containing 101 isoform X2 [Betta splendens]|nr:tripartite motif containing 101 isoform X2 [Betta splendens]